MDELPKAMLMLAGYGLWIAVYVLVIRRAMLDRRCGVPMAVICLDLAWEFHFGFIEPQIPLMAAGNKLWFFCDLALLLPFIRFGRQDLPAPINGRFFVPILVLSTLMCYAGLVCYVYEYGDFTGRMSGYIINLIISVLFVSMLLHRNSIAGQSFYIGLAKCLGTLCFSIAATRHDPTNRFLLFLCLAILCFDCLYMFLVARQCRAEGIAVWRRL